MRLINPKGMNEKQKRELRLCLKSSKLAMEREKLIACVAEGMANIEEGGLEASLTGPIPRGDVETVGMHLRALDAADRRLYALLGRSLVRLSAPRLDEDTRRELLEIFETESGE